MTTIKNMTGASVSIGSLTIRPGVSISTNRWHILQHSDNAKSLLAAKAIEVSEAVAEQAGKAAKVSK